MPVSGGAARRCRCLVEQPFNANATWSSLSLLVMIAVQVERWCVVCTCHFSFSLLFHSFSYQLLIVQLFFSSR